MKKFSVDGIFIAFVLTCYFLITLKPNTEENDFSSSQFQNRVFNTNVLLITTDDSPTYFSGTLLNYRNKVYILTCGHGIEDLETLDNLRAISIEYKEDGSVSEEKILDIKLISASLSEERDGQDLAIFEVLNEDFRCFGALFKNVPLKPKDKIVCIGNSYGKYSYSVYEGNITKTSMNIREEWSPFFITSCEVRQGCSGGGVFIKREGNYYYCGMINRSDTRGIGMFKPFYVIQKWLGEQGFTI